MSVVCEVVKVVIMYFMCVCLNLYEFFSVFGDCGIGCVFMKYSWWV